MSSTLEQELSYLRGKVKRLTKQNAELRRELEQKNKSITVYKYSDKEIDHYERNTFRRD